jgi:hypothetical protein
MNALRAAVRELLGEHVLVLLSEDILQRLLTAGYTDKARLQGASFDELWATGLPDALSKALPGPKLLQFKGALHQCTGNNG